MVVLRELVLAGLGGEANGVSLVGGAAAVVSADERGYGRAW
jgi:hypothetical protein